MLHYRFGNCHTGFQSFQVLIDDQRSKSVKHGLVRLQGVLTPAEQQLTKSVDGVELIKRMRSTLIENARPILFKVIGDITGAKVIGLHTDTSTVAGERVIVFVLDRDLEKELPRKKTS